MPIIDKRDIDVAIEKNLHVNRAGRMNTGKLCIPDLRSVEKTSVSIIIIASGFRRDQRNPRTEFRYLSLNSLIVRFKTSSEYRNKLMIFPA